MQERGPLLEIHNPNGRVVRAGAFRLMTIAQLVAQIEQSPPLAAPRPQCLLKILTREDRDSTHFVDVGRLQSDPANKLAVFQAASNFNTVEAMEEATPPDSESFTEKYIYDVTQGPQASVSAGGAAITRVHAAFYDPSKPASEWNQTAKRQVELLGNVKEYYTVQNGYVVFTRKEKPLPQSEQEREALLAQMQVGLHTEAEVTFAGFHDPDNLMALPPSANPQLIDQVFCAAVNIAQGYSGEANAEAPGAIDKAKLVLRAAYRGSYLAAIANGRTKLFLTLIGGGVFGNKMSDIYDIILQEHKKWTRHPRNSLQEVSIVQYSWIEDTLAFANKLQADPDISRFLWTSAKDGKQYIYQSKL
jgi:hypothetical protein